MRDENRQVSGTRYSNIAYGGFGGGGSNHGNSGYAAGDCVYAGGSGYNSQLKHGGCGGS